MTVSGNNGGCNERNRSAGQPQNKVIENRFHNLPYYIKNSNSITSVAEPEPLVRLRNRRRFVDRPEPNLKFVLIITGNFFRALTNFSQCIKTEPTSFDRAGADPILPEPESAPRLRTFKAEAVQKNGGSATQSTTIGIFYFSILQVEPRYYLCSRRS